VRLASEVNQLKTDNDKKASTASSGMASDMEIRTGECADKTISDQGQSVQELSEELAHANRERLQEELQHKKREEKLINSMKQQRKLAAHLMATHEEERTVVAHEIHEELGQMLAALQMNVALISMEYHEHAPLVARANMMEQLITSSLMAVQRISSELRPVMLDLLGLADAMEWKAQKFQQKTGIPCKTVIILAEKKVDRAISTAFYRIFQEALSNVIRHSGATLVQMNLMERKGWLTLSVRDDGRGIIEKEKTDLMSLGIAGIRGRTEDLGGKLRIFGSPQYGTALFARIPLTGKGD
jgi:signal transduction histidine kinase